MSSQEKHEQSDARTQPCSRGFNQPGDLFRLVLCELSGNLGLIGELADDEGRAYHLTVDKHRHRLSDVLIAGARHPLTSFSSEG